MKWFAVAGLAMAAAGPAPAGREVWLIVSLQSPCPSISSLRAWPKPTRLVLAVEDFRTGSVPPSFLETVRVLQEWMGPDFILPVYDPQALATLRRVGVRRLPAVLVFDGGTVHVCEGLPRDPKEALSCER